MDNDTIIVTADRVTLVTTDTILGDKLMTISYKYISLQSFNSLHHYSTIGMIEVRKLRFNFDQVKIFQPYNEPIDQLVNKPGVAKLF